MLGVGAAPWFVGAKISVGAGPRSSGDVSLACLCRDEMNVRMDGAVGFDTDSSDPKLK